MWSFTKNLGIVVTPFFILILLECRLQDNLADCYTLKSRFLRNYTINFRGYFGNHTTTTSTTTPLPVTKRLSPQKATLPLGLTLIGSVGSKSFYTDPDKLGLAWAEALDFCHILGMQPASLENLVEHKVVRNYLGKLPHRFFWLAGTDYFHEGHWRWLKSGAEFKFNKWTQGFPSKSRKNNCLYLSYGNDGWIDASCSSNKLLIRPLCQTV